MPKWLSTWKVLSEVILILLIGGTLCLDSWNWRAVGLALFLFSACRNRLTAVSDRADYHGARFQTY